MRTSGRVQIGAWVLKRAGAGGWVWGKARPRVIKGQPSEEMVTPHRFVGQEIPFVELFGAWVYEQRHLAGLSKYALSKTSGISRRTIQRIEEGRVDPSLSTVVKLIRSLSDASVDLL